MVKNKQALLLLLSIVLIVASAKDSKEKPEDNEVKTSADDLGQCSQKGGEDYWTRLAKWANTLPALVKQDQDRIDQLLAPLDALAPDEVIKDRFYQVKMVQN